MITYVIAKNYTDTPGPRYESEGQFSGENFRNTVLLDLLKKAKEQSTSILIDFDGGYGYPTSFLEEAFGGLVRVTKDRNILSIFSFKSDEEPSLIKEVESYIKAAIEALK